MTFMRHLGLSIGLLATVLCTSPGSGAVVEGQIELPNGVFAELSPAIVYVQLPERADGSGSVPDAVVDQRNLQFRPRVQALQLGGRIVLRNSDRELHNVNTRGPCCRFNRGVAPGATFADKTTTPRRPGVVPLLCDVHPHMRGYVVVVPDPYFCGAEPDGRFRIEGVPEGPAVLRVWQEFCEPFEREIVVAGDKQETAKLKRKAGLIVSTASAPVPWPEVLSRISDTLTAAVAAAQRPGGAQEAERLALDAYFEHFEANELEPAIGRFVGGPRKFELERMFLNEVRQGLADLSAGKCTAQQVEEAIAVLLGELTKDVKKLNERGVRDKSALAVAPAADTWAAEAERLSGAEVQDVLRGLHRDFRTVGSLADAGKPHEAASALANAYFGQFHRVEPLLLSRDYRGTRQIEAEFLQLRNLLLSGKPAGVGDRLVGLYRDIERAAEPRSFWATVLNALFIIVREGVEAILIITALVTFLVKVGQRDQVRYVTLGVLWAAVASLVTWAALEWVLAEAGFAQEMLEGIVALTAAGVLFYVSYWLISKSQAQAWQRFLSSRIEASVTRGSSLGLAVTAFLAVYREGAETILMLRPVVGGGSAGWLTLLVALAVGGVLLVGVFWGFRYAGMRMPLRGFFAVTGVMLFALAVVFAGKGTAELQEAGLLRVTPLAWVPHVPDIGLFPTVQSVLIQSVLVGGALVAGLMMLLANRDWSTASLQSVPKAEGVNT